jgi:cobalt-zinc-cadmium efflux system membrane fusion protein
MVIILAGLSLDDQVVTSQGFALKSEVLKARLGASCADH